MKLKPIKNKSISTMIGSLIIYIGVAFVLPLNNFSVYITSYIHLAQPSVTMHYGMFINLIFSFAMTASNPLGGYLENYIGFFKTIFLGFTILFIGNLLFILQQNIWLCYFLSIILGLGVGIGTSVILKNLTFFYPEKKGLISGIMGLGILLITGIFALTGEKIIAFNGYTLKEGEEFYPDYIAKRTYIFYLVGEFCIPIGLGLALLFIYEYKPEENLKDTKEEEQQQIINAEEGQTVKNEKKDDNIENKEKKENSKQNIYQVIKTFRYWRITLISFLINFSISFMVNTGRIFGALLGINGTALQFSGIFQTIAVIIIGPVLGILVDKKGPLFILRIISILSIVPGVLLTFYMKITWIFILAFIISVLNVTGLMISFSPFIMEIYGIQESVILGGIINGISKFSDVITTVSSFIFSIFYKGINELIVPYKIMYLISAIFCVISSLLLFIETSDKYDYGNNQTEQDLLNKENEDALLTPDKN